MLDRLEGLGIGYREVTELLEREGVDKFAKSWAELLQTVTDELDRAKAHAEGARAEGEK